MAEIRMCDRPGCGSTDVRVRKGEAVMIEIEIPQSAPTGGGAATGPYKVRMGLIADADLCRADVQAGAAVYITLPDVEPTLLS